MLLREQEDDTGLPLNRHVNMEDFGDINKITEKLVILAVKKGKCCLFYNEVTSE
jgi:hypothetical protein